MATKLPEIGSPTPSPISAPDHLPAPPPPRTRRSFAWVCLLVLGVADYFGYRFYAGSQQQKQADNGWSQRVQYYAGDSSNHFDSMPVRFDKRFSGGLLGPIPIGVSSDLIAQRSMLHVLPENASSRHFSTLKEDLLE